jgi:hypothetical protein
VFFHSGLLTGRSFAAQNYGYWLETATAELAVSFGVQLALASLRMNEMITDGLNNVPTTSWREKVIP